MSRSKRKHEDAMGTFPAAVFDDLPLDVVMSFMEPLDLLACMHLNKNSRRVAGRKLNAYKYDVQTQFQQQMFANWLVEPSVSGPSRVCEEEMNVISSKGNLSGPLRLWKIEEMKSNLKKNFFILKYKKTTYTEEESQVAIFDNEGCLVAIYKFSSVQHYESYVDKEVLTNGRRVFNSRGGTNHGTARMGFCNSGQLAAPGARQLENAWRMRWVQTDFEWQEGFMGFVAEPNYGLFCLFHGLLSPTETATVLMHALSMDTRAIHTYTLAVFDNFGHELDLWDHDDWGDREEELEEFKNWMEQLRSTNYEDDGESSDEEEGADQEEDEDAHELQE